MLSWREPVWRVHMRRHSPSHGSQPLPGPGQPRRGHRRCGGTGRTHRVGSCLRNKFTPGTARGQPDPPRGQAGCSGQSPLLLVGALGERIRPLPHPKSSGALPTGTLLLAVPGTRGATLMAPLPWGSHRNCWQLTVSREAPRLTAAAPTEGPRVQTSPGLPGFRLGPPPRCCSQPPLAWNSGPHPPLSRAQKALSSEPPSNASGGP